MPRGRSPVVEEWSGDIPVELVQIIGTSQNTEICSVDGTDAGMDGSDKWYVSPVLSSERRYTYDRK